jgi:cysteine-rich repeat protein
MFLKKMGCLIGDKKAQLAIEQMILTGIILVALIPVAYFLTQNQTRTPYLTDAMNVLDNTVESLSNLGAGSSDTVVVNIPGDIVNVTFVECESGSDTKCKAIQITYGDGSVDIFEMEYFIGGTIEFFYIPGVHYVTLFNDNLNQQIVFQECGDGLITGGEQCEPCEDVIDCETGETCEKEDSGNQWGTCTINNVDACVLSCKIPTDSFGCFCGCFDDLDCPVGICSPDGVCEGCENDDDCDIGEFCDLGNCETCDMDMDDDEFLYTSACNIPPLDCNDDEPNENTSSSSYEGFGTCDDGYDNDCSGAADCNDINCFGIPPCPGSLCGDGTTQTFLNEECDDGNNLNGDGCNSFCQFEFAGDNTTIAYKFASSNSHVSNITYPTPGNLIINLSANLALKDPTRVCGGGGSNLVMYIFTPGNNSHMSPPEDIPTIPTQATEVCYGDLQCQTALNDVCSSLSGGPWECVTGFKGVGGSQFNAHIDSCVTGPHRLCCKRP